jgi:starch phosphorylase
MADVNPAAQDAADAEALYQVLEREVVPLFYTRDDAGLPTGWLARVRASMKSLLPIFNTHRMLKEYTEQIYLGDEGA